MEIKICGITNFEDAIDAFEAGADYIGFVFYPHSKRNIRATVMKDIMKNLKGKIKTVGVFVNEAPQNILRIAEQCELDIVQLHGEENPDDFNKFPIPIWRAIRCGDNFCSPEPLGWNTTRYVVDAFVKDVYGGTGQTCNWELAAKLAKNYPIMLSGGLTCENVKSAISTVKPVGIDVSSGVEEHIGKKSKERMRTFITIVREFCKNIAEKEI